MHVTILGAGYIGMALLQQWSDPNIEFWATTTSTDKVALIEPMVDRVVVLEGRERDKVAQLVDATDVLIVCVAPSSSDNYREVYLETAHSIAAATSGRRRPLQIVYTSSTSVYGDQGGAWADESTERNPLSESARVLCDVEDVILGCDSEVVTSCVVRLGGIYGPGRGLQARAQRMSGRALSGSGALPTNHSHRDDIVAGIRFCVANQVSGVVNLVNDDHVSRKQLYSTLCARMGIPEPTWGEGQVLRHGSNCKVSNQRIKDLGFHFTYPLVLTNSEERV